MRMRNLILGLIVLTSMSVMDASAKDKAASRTGCIIERPNGCVYLRSGQWTHELVGKDLPKADTGHQVRIRGTDTNGTSGCSTRTTIGAIEVKSWSILWGGCK